MMPRGLRFILASCGLALSIMLVLSSVSAQDATPVSEAVDPAECTVEPRTIASIARLAVKPAPVANELTPRTGEGDAANGKPVDQATIDAVTAAYREFVACLNTGDILRVYAFYTDDYLRRSLARGAIDLERLDATPRPPPQSQRASLIGVHEVRRLEDDRLAARVETSNPTAEGRVAVEAILVPSGDRLLIDNEMIAAPIEARGRDAATPVPGNGNADLHE
jgi:hypothetical protein